MTTPREKWGSEEQWKRFLEQRDLFEDYFTRFNLIAKRVQALVKIPLVRGHEEGMRAELVFRLRSVIWRAYVIREETEAVVAKITDPETPITGATAAVASLVKTVQRAVRQFGPLGRGDKH